ncbi:Poly [ADP-ribose] polymerase 1 [Hypsibius exemplaris]|uniref:Poly [ADP-ribose] polymerase n=1 Tax=Hypsibius exemplaris TaxID=2072580 RepID=A0A9X6NI70_HYPEX|nr:Poly [ADP-ribose] polymerase 1 [Hypsibius exemplaris]
MATSSWVYRAEYSLSDRSSCKKCGNGIGKNVVRLCILQQSRFHDGKDTLWHHPHCFFQRKPNVNVDEIWHFHDLRWADQLRLRKLAAGKTAKIDNDEEEEEEDAAEVDEKKGKRKKKQGSAGSKKIKPGADDLGSADLREQIEMIWACRDQVASLTNKEMKTILEANDQHVPVSGKMLDRLTDVLVFGATEKCTVCASPTGHIVVSADAYRCVGSASEWAKCDFKTQSPARKVPTIPADLLKKHPFLEQYTKWQRRERRFAPCFGDISGENVEKPATNGSAVTVVSEPSTSKGTGGGASKPQRKTEKSKEKFYSKHPLKALRISAVGAALPVKRANLTKMVAALGGDFTAKVSKDTFLLITDAKTILSRPVTVEMAEVCGVTVVPVEFLQECQGEKLKSQKDLVALVEQMKINPWATTAASLMEKLASKSAQPDLTSGLSSSERHRLEEQTKSSRFVIKSDARAQVIIKNGGALDPESNLDDATHSVFRDNGILYACVLARTNVSDGTNGYYKMQIIKRDGREDYHFFRSWGRIGTVIGGTTCAAMEKEEAIEAFEFQFMDKTGNEWKNRERFVKKPSKYFIMELDYGQEEADSEESAVAAGSKTKLEKPIQDVIKMIFDVEEMKKTMKMFEIDLRKMPLGKLHRKQILEAMSVLGELQNLLVAGERVNSPRVIGASNRFFTLIPHDFGVQAPPVLNNVQLVKDKLEMLENLLEIEVAFSILRNETKNTNEDPLDQHYEKLKCKMEVLRKDSKEFKLICQYVENTHAATHTAYKLSVVDVFCIDRQGEADRFASFRKMPNHKLLWHGSRTTNYAGILSQGLRIAPPEAPVTGYMFGKGVYFADMVTKSANYCFTDPSNPTGLMLLSDVALGSMHELTEATCITRLPKGFDSVKGTGQDMPNPKEAVVTPDGIEIPLGHSVKSGVKNTSLLYNEYIVYNEAQINLRYLLKVKFNYAK